MVLGNTRSILTELPATGGPWRSLSRSPPHCPYSDQQKQVDMEARPSSTVRPTALVPLQDPQERVASTVILGGKVPTAGAWEPL